MRNFEKVKSQNYQISSNPMLMQSYFAVHEPKLAELLRDHSFGAKSSISYLGSFKDIAEREKV